MPGHFSSRIAFSLSFAGDRLKLTNNDLETEPVHEEPLPCRALSPQLELPASLCLTVFSKNEIAIAGRPSRLRSFRNTRSAGVSQ